VLIERGVLVNVVPGYKGEGVAKLVIRSDFILSQKVLGNRLERQYL